MRKIRVCLLALSCSLIGGFATGKSDSAANPAPGQEITACALSPDTDWYPIDCTDIALALKSILTPANGAVFDTAPKVFKWSRVQSATRYRLKLAHYDSALDQYIVIQKAWIPQPARGKPKWRPPADSIPTGAFRWSITDYSGPQPGAALVSYFTVSKPPPPGTVLIPAGTNRGTDPDSGHYELTVSAFYMNRMEVSKAEWDSVRNWGLAHGYTDLPEGIAKTDNRPVLYWWPTGWFAAAKWCNARSEMEGRTPAYYTSADKSTVYRTGRVELVDDFVDWNNGYRLPTGMEWDYAARGGLRGKRFPWGDTIAHSQANYYSVAWLSYDKSETRGPHPDYADSTNPTSQAQTSPVGSFAPNGYGLYDMAGNAAEWIWDHGTWMTFRPAMTICGGDCKDNASLARCGDRHNPEADDPSENHMISFRPVLPGN